MTTWRFTKLKESEVGGRWPGAGGCSGCHLGVWIQKGCSEHGAGLSTAPTRQLSPYDEPRKIPLTVRQVWKAEREDAVDITKNVESRKVGAGMVRAAGGPRTTRTQSTPNPSAPV
jgi:hypothetical protein